MALTPTADLFSRQTVLGLTLEVFEHLARIPGVGVPNRRVERHQMRQGDMEPPWLHSLAHDDTTVSSPHIATAYAPEDRPSERDRGQERVDG